VIARLLDSSAEYRRNKGKSVEKAVNTKLYTASEMPANMPNYSDTAEQEQHSPIAILP